MSIRSWCATAADLVIGAECAGCGSPSLTLCDACRGALVPAVFEGWPDPVPSGLRTPTSVTPWSAAAYEGPLRSALSCFKEDGQFGLLPTLSVMLGAAVESSVPRASRVLLVPVPSSAASRRRRGGDAIEQLARSTARQLRGRGLDCGVSGALQHRRAVSDQSGLGAVDRQRNLIGAFRALDRLPSGRVVVVVDDIITTGATAAEAVRALTKIGHRPIAIATVAATRRRLPPGREGVSTYRW